MSTYASTIKGQSGFHQYSCIAPSAPLPCKNQASFARHMGAILRGATPGSVIYASLVDQTSGKVWAQLAPLELTGCHNGDASIRATEEEEPQNPRLPLEH